MAQWREGCLIRGEEGVCEMKRGASRVQNGGSKGGTSGAFCLHVPSEKIQCALTNKPVA